MRCINKKHVSLLLCFVCLLCGCQTKQVALSEPYDVYQTADTMIGSAAPTSSGKTYFSEDLCVADDTEVGTDTTDAFVAEGAGTFNLATNTIVYQKNIYNKLYPASTTKILTAYIILKYCNNLDETVTISENAAKQASDSSVCGVNAGDVISVRDLLYGLMLESNNYYALYLAEYVAGDVQSFCDRMNEKAMQLGATNTHFMNPHGLDNPNHYSTAYDMYLIIKEVHSHQILRDIDGFDTYTYTFYDTNGAAIDTESTATNMFITGDVALPATFQIESWKTGTTDGAGNCLAMYLIRNGKTYVVVASSGKSKQDLYDSIVRLLCLTD